MREVLLKKGNVTKYEPIGTMIIAAVKPRSLTITLLVHCQFSGQEDLVLVDVISACACGAAARNFALRFSREEATSQPQRVMKEVEEHKR